MKKSIDLTANGKLLLTGEYLVLSGARALALPVRFGQTLHGNPSEIPGIRWSSSQPGGVWFSCELDPGNFDIRTAANPQIASHLVRLLKAARNYHPSFLAGSPGWDISVEANYHLDWGMGSSSTLISLVAQWSETDPFKLFRAVSQGSGYDIACATRKEMFFYRCRDEFPEILSASPGKALREHACFAFLGRKQETSREVSIFLSTKNDNQVDIDRISELSEMICNAEEPVELIRLVEEHEAIIGRTLRRDPVALRFPSFPGTVKSLGAWGGDFVMFVSRLNHFEVGEWLKGEGFTSIFFLEELQIS